MSKKKLQYRQRLAALFTSFSVLIMGAGSLLRSMSLDYYTVLATLIKIAPACLTMGLLGWVMGMILDQPKRRSRIAYGGHFVNELMKTSLPSASSANIEEESATPAAEGV